MYSVHVTPKSANAKTGPIPVSTSSRSTCSKACPFIKNGCYADSGPLALHWNKVTEGSRGTDWQGFCNTVAGFANDTLWRHNQAGDLPGDGVTIDQLAMMDLLTANKGKRGFTYTHYTMASESNRNTVKLSNSLGFTINLSANNLQHADELKALNIGPVVVVVDSNTDAKTFKTPAGHSVVVCPATYKDSVSCATCQLCQRQRDTIVAFPAHGTSKAKANRVIMLQTA